MHPLRVLIAADRLTETAGSELHLLDLATGLLAQGHLPVVFAPRLGAVADELRGATVPVTDRLGSLGDSPDLIHGQHALATVLALLHFPESPAVYCCQSWLPWETVPPRFGRIGCYVVFENACRDRLLCEAGIPEDRVRVIPSFVGVQRFLRRQPLPDHPQRVLIVTAGEQASGHVAAVTEACRRAGLAFDFMGDFCRAYSTAWQEAIANHDLVFAAGPAALEAMAGGASVILCNHHGLGPIVAAANVDSLHVENFGHRLLRHPLRVEDVLEQIQLFNAADATSVTARIHEIASQAAGVGSLLNIYQQAIERFASERGLDHRAESRAISDYLRLLSPELQQKEAEKARREAEELCRQRDQCREDRDRLQAEKEQLSAQRDQTQALFDYFKFEHDLIKPERDYLERENKRLQEERELREKEWQAQREAEAAAHRDQYQRLANDRSALSDEHARLSAEHDRLSAEHAGLSARHDQLRVERQALATACEDLRAEIDRRQSAESSLTARNNALLEELARLRSLQSALQKSCDEEASERRRLEEQQDHLRAERQQLQANLHAVYSSVAIRVRERLLATPVLGRVTRSTARRARSLKRWLSKSWRGCGR